MKKHGKSSKMYVIIGLLAVLFVSLGVLSMQGRREGMKNKKVTEKQKQKGIQASLENMPNGSAVENLMKLEAENNDINNT
jgi:hypothetical protein